MVSAGLGSYLKTLLGKDWFPSYVDDGRIQSLVVLGLKVSVICWLSAGGCPWLLEAGLRSLPHEPPNMTTCFIKANKGGSVFANLGSQSYVTRCNK